MTRASMITSTRGGTDRNTGLKLSPETTPASPKSSKDEEKFKKRVCEWEKGTFRKHNQRSVVKIKVEITRPSELM